MSFKEIVDKYENKITQISEYKNPFSTYQDMLDGEFVMEYSDDDAADSETEEVEDVTVVEEKVGDDTEVENNKVVNETEVREEEVVNDTDADDDIDTSYEELFNHLQKVEESNALLKKDVEKLKTEVILIIISLYLILILFFQMLLQK